MINEIYSSLIKDQNRNSMVVTMPVESIPPRSWRTRLIGRPLATADAPHQAIGKIVGGCIWWCGGALWYQKKRPDESDADYMVRNWVSFAEMSGDHIVEQHVHNLDVANWYIGHPPVLAIGYGGRARRKTGDQFDFFSIEYDYEDDVHIHSMCRQVNGTYGRVSEHFIGTEGSTWGDGKMKSKKMNGMLK